MSAIASQLGVPYNGNVRVAGWAYPVDFFIEEAGLVIQYDSKHYHAERSSQDKRCNRELRAAGWNVLRIREHGLARISNTQISVGGRETATSVASRTATYLRQRELVSAS